MKIFDAVKSIPRGVRSFANEVRREYAARQLEAGLHAVERASRDFDQMSLAEKEKVARDYSAIQERAQELRVARASKVRRAK